MKGKQNMKVEWKNPFERLINEKTEGEAKGSSMGVEAGGKCLIVQKEIDKERKENNVEKLQVWMK